MGWLEPFGHGGDLRTASEKLGVEPSELLDFSANINPLGPPPSVFAAMREGMLSMAHYPDPAQRTFREALSRRLNVPMDWLLCGNGAAECMALAILALQPEKVGLIYPCFSEYEHLSRQFGAKVCSILGTEEAGFKPDPAELRGLFEQADLIFVGHPNNPTGQVYGEKELLQMAEWSWETGTYLVMDEAFLDFLPPADQVSLLPMLEGFPNVLLIRSMTKLYAIPGLRLGFAIGNPALIQKMRGKQVTWSVNQMALLAGEICLMESDYENKTRQLIEKERDFLAGSIRCFPGWKVWPGQANYLLVRLPSPMRAVDLQMRLGKRGIMIRDCSMYQGLTPQDFRIAVRTRKENERLIYAIKESVKEMEGVG